MKSLKAGKEGRRVSMLEGVNDRRTERAGRDLGDIIADGREGLGGYGERRGFTTEGMKTAGE
jgi:hypothetical protein